MTSTADVHEGVVRTWDDDEGWGVIESAQTPGGCWTHFSVIVAEGFLKLSPGEHVSFTSEAEEQDGHSFRATAVWRL